jgi:hypothetical protein
MPVRLHRALVLIFASASITSHYAVADAAAPVTVSLAQHAENRERLLALLQSCIADASQCREEKVGPDELVKLPNGTSTDVHYDWLRDNIKSMAAAGADRAALGKHSLAYLQSSGSDAADTPAQTQKARQDADFILSQNEFLPSSDSSWAWRQWERFGAWLGRKLDAASASGTSWSWVRTLFQVGLFSVPVILLLMWLFRIVREERALPSRKVDIRHTLGSAPIDWFALADAQAAKGEWREAIHSLYWGTIAHFEAHHVWGPSRTRTPREYLRLLQPGSPRERSLREQTRLLETTWYGYREATVQDYARARELRGALVTE